MNQKIIIIGGVIVWLVTGYFNAGCLIGGLFLGAAVGLFAMVARRRN